MKKVAATAASLFLLLYWASAQQERCGFIGNSDETAATPSRAQQFYLDTGHPADCTGIVTGWRVCYYGPDSVNSVGSYFATFAVYRKMGAGDSAPYNRVTEIPIFSATRTGANFTGNSLVDTEIIQGGFNCYNSSIVPFTIQAGDVLGACVFDPDGDDILPLDVVSNVTGESLLQMAATSECSVEAIPSPVQSAGMQGLSMIDNRRLHIYANIDQEFVTTNTPADSILTTTMAATTLTSESVVTATVTSPGGNGASSSLVVVGVVIGVLVSLVLGVAIVVIVLYFVRHRLTGGKFLTGRRSSEKKLFSVDNLTYEARGTMTINGEGREALEASAYEVPVNTMQPVWSKTANENHESFEATYALPDYPTNEALDKTTISYAQLLEQNKEEDIYGNVEVYLQPATGENELYTQIKAYGIKNITSDHIQIKGRLGSGQFGFVEQGVWRNGARDIQVALKLLKEGASEIDKVKFLQEAAIMAQFTHPNVVSLYGVVSKTEPLMLVVELVQKGDLRYYLHTMRPDPGELPASNMAELLLSFCQQVALGMHYLSSKGFVHRDLAARNILVSKDNICKVSDFGMSRDLADEAYYVSQGGKIPVKWTAPEAINYKKYSTASDVWSFGCLLYEIWSLGYKPFEGVQNPTVIEIVDSGKRLPPPPGCSRVIYELMIKCWNPVAGLRPSFRELLLTLLRNPKAVLSIPQEALDTHNLAGVLGSPLDVGESMYRDLQNKYCSEDNHDYQEMD